MLLIATLLLLICPIAWGVLIEASPSTLVSTVNAEMMKALLKEFPVDDANLRAVTTLLKYPEHDFFRYYIFPEEPDRAALFEPFATDTDFHDTIFTIWKVNMTTKWYKWFFSTDKVTKYQGNMFKGNDFRFPDKQVNWKLVKFTIRNCSDKMNTIYWLPGILKGCDEMDALKVFSWFNKADVTTDLLKIVGQIGDGLAILNAFDENLVRLSSQDIDLYRIILSRTRTSPSTFRKSDLRLMEVLNISPVFPNPPMYELKGALDTLNSMREDRTDRAFWNTFVDLALQTIGSKWEDKDIISWIVEKIPKDVLYTGKMTKLIEKTCDLFGSPQERLLAMTPVEFHPETLLPLQEKRRRWLLSSLFKVENTNAILDSEDLKRFYAKGFGANFSLPLNWRYLDANNLEMNLTEKLILESTRVLGKNSKFTAEDLGMILISWPLLVRIREKRDFSRIFLRTLPSGDWHSVAGEMVANFNAPVVRNHILDILKRLGVDKAFTPKQLRELIDSSYDPPKDQ